MKKVGLVLCLLGMVAVCSSSFGVTMTWYNLQNSTNWSTNGNWKNATTGLYSGLPLSGDYVMIGDGYGSGGTVVVAAPAVCNNIQLAPSAKGSGTLTIESSLTVGGVFYGNNNSTSGSTATITLDSASSSLSCATALYIGYAGQAALNISAGDVSTTGTSNLLVGWNGNGTVNMSGGTMHPDQFKIAYNVGHTGTVNLSGGTIYTNWLDLGGGTGAAGKGTSTLTLSGNGTLIVDATKYTSNTVNQWKTYIDSWMGTQILNAQDAIVGNTVVITAVPEPATIAVLGLGGLLAIRRKK